MAKLSFIALVITSLLPGGPAAHATPFCAKGHLDKTTIDNGILNPVNARREKLAQGTQKNGDSGTNLPPATNMPKLAWSCELEKDALNAISDKCADPANPVPPANGAGRANIFLTQYQGKDISSPGEVFNDFLNNYLIQIDMNRLEVRRHGTVTSNPVYSGDDLLLGYADLVRATNTEIGCAMNMCSGPDGEPVITFYCLLNGKTIKENEEIYQGTTVNEGEE